MYVLHAYVSLNTFREYCHLWLHLSLFMKISLILQLQEGFRLLMPRSRATIDIRMISREKRVMYRKRLYVHDT